MKCKKCGNEIKLKEAKFCPFCGGDIEPEIELAGYTRAQFFNFIGDDEFRTVWETLKSMSADEALDWLREKPPAHYVWKILGSWTEEDSIRKRRRERCIYRSSIKYLEGGDEAKPVKRKLCFNELTGFGDYVFWTREECEAAIKEEIEKCSTTS